MTRTFTIKVTRRNARYTVEVKGTVPLEGERGRFRASARAWLLKRAVQEAFTTLDPFAAVSPATDERHEQHITPSVVAATLRLEVTPGDETECPTTRCTTGPRETPCSSTARRRSSSRHPATRRASRCRDRHKATPATHVSARR